MAQTYAEIFERNRYQLSDMTRQSYVWFEQQARLLNLQQIGPSSLLKNNDLKNYTVASIMPGEMYFFKYLPKYMNKLPMWDMYPLVFPFKIVKGGFIGLNFHYLDPMMRVYLLDQLSTFTVNTRQPEKIRLKLSWDVLNRLSKYAGVQMCVHRYRGDCIASPMKKIDAINWPTALMLPIAKMISGEYHNG